MIPNIPETAPFSRAQRSWLNGFFAGLYAVREVEGLPGNDSAQAGVVAPGLSISVLFGSQTGTSEGLAKKTAKALKGRGIAAAVKDLADVDPASLASMDNVLVITSTYGDGEMPDNAQDFWDAVSADDAPTLEGMRFSVCGLGDSSYPDFCQAGKDIDARFEALGATRVHPRIDCDVDFDDDFDAWMANVIDAILAADAPELQAA